MIDILGSISFLPGATQNYFAWAMIEDAEGEIFGGT